MNNLLTDRAARCAFLFAPIQFRTIPPKTWAGVLIPHDVDIEGQRRPVRIEDSSYLRYGAADDVNMGEL